MGFCRCMDFTLPAYPLRLCPCEHIKLPSGYKTHTL